jgi:hypothetical protein
MTAGDLTETMPTCAHTAAERERSASAKGGDPLPSDMVVGGPRTVGSIVCFDYRLSEAARRQMERGAPLSGVTPLT